MRQSPQSGSSAQSNFTNGAGTLILVRHGETEGQSSIRYHGRGDVALDERGRAQMRAAARLVERDHFTKVFASPLVRATEGARIIAGADTDVIPIAEFVEIDFGDFEGLTIDEIRDRFPDEFQRWRTQRLEAAYQYPGGESGEAFRARVQIGMERMFGLWRDDGNQFSGTALLVAHRGVIRLIVQRLTGITPAIELGSIQILECNHGWSARALDLIGKLG